MRVVSCEIAIEAACPAASGACRYASLRSGGHVGRFAPCIRPMFGMSGRFAPYVRVISIYFSCVYTILYF